MSNITVELTETSNSATKKVSFPFSNVAIIGCSCSSSNECSSYKVTLPRGAYAIDCFGASGINESKGYSLGGHIYGTINLLRTTTFYLHIGQKGEFNGPKTYGGGGKGNIYSWAGGGATDVRLLDDDDFNGLKSRIMVAGGGGGFTIYHNYEIDDGDNGNAGGLEGEGGFYIDGTLDFKIEINLSTGGTQVSGGIGGWSPETETNPNYNLSPERNGQFGIGGSTIYGSGGGGGGPLL